MAKFSGQEVRQSSIVWTTNTDRVARFSSNIFFKMRILTKDAGPQSSHRECKRANMFHTCTIINAILRLFCIHSDYMFFLANGIIMPYTVHLRALEKLDTHCTGLGHDHSTGRANSRKTGRGMVERARRCTIRQLCNFS